MFKYVALIRVGFIILRLHFGNFSVEIVFLLQLLFPHQVWRAIKGQFLCVKLICRAWAKLWLQNRPQIPVLQCWNSNVAIATCLLGELLIEPASNDRQIALWSNLWLGLIIQYQLLLHCIVLLKLTFTSKIRSRLVESIGLLSHLDAQFIAGFYWLQLSYRTCAWRIQSIISTTSRFEMRIIDRFDQLCVFECWNTKLHLGS